jgi:Ni,Fe-hydrogenase maturation factor
MDKIESASINPRTIKTIESAFNLFMKIIIKLVISLVRKDLIRLKNENPQLYGEIRNNKNREYIYNKIEKEILPLIRKSIDVSIDKIISELDNEKKGGFAIKSVIQKTLKIGINQFIKRGVMPVIKEDLIKLKRENPKIYNGLKEKKNREFIYNKFEKVIIPLLRKTIDRVIENVINELEKEKGVKRVKIDYEANKNE